MTIANQPIGWKPEKTEATFVIANLAVTTGSVLKISPRAGSSKVAQGFEVAAAPTTGDQPGTCYGVALEDRTTSDTSVRLLLRGWVNAFTYDTGTNPNAGKGLVVAQGDGGAAVGDLMTFDDATSAESRKIVAISESNNNTSGQQLGLVDFNGIEGFGHDVGESDWPA